MRLPALGALTCLTGLALLLLSTWYSFESGGPYEIDPGERDSSPYLRSLRSLKSTSTSTSDYTSSANSTSRGPGYVEDPGRRAARWKQVITTVFAILLMFGSIMVVVACNIWCLGGEQDEVSSTAGSMLDIEMVSCADPQEFDHRPR